MNARTIMAMAAMFGAHDGLPGRSSGGSRVKDTAGDHIHEQAKAKAEAKRARRAAKRLAGRSTS